MLAYQRPKSLVEAVTARLRKEIVDGKFELGEGLSESKIASRYDVSRTPVREAFAKLGLEGLVHSEPQRGTFIFQIDRKEFEQISEARSILETGALLLVAERKRNELQIQWGKIVDDMKVALSDDNIKRYSRFDRKFHETLFALTNNPYLIAAGQSFSAKLSTVINRHTGRPDHTEMSFHQHVEMYETVKSGDIDKAAELLDQHIRYGGAAFWSDPET